MADCFLTGNQHFLVVITGCIATADQPVAPCEMANLTCLGIAQMF